jgi:hypothetical protein
MDAKMKLVENTVIGCGIEIFFTLAVAITIFSCPVNAQGNTGYQHNSDLVRGPNWSRRGQRA